MTLQLDDTIAALASAAGPGARGVVRISGPCVREVLELIFEPADSERWRQTRNAERHEGRFTLAPSYAAVEEPAAPQTALPCAVYLWPTGRSYTGQPMAELHAVGSPPLLEAVLATLFAGHVRPARPGEFTLRAFLAGRVDLVQAEAVLGVVDAHDHEELQVALQQLAGGISSKIDDVRRSLLDLLADLEAGLDFVEEDIEFIDRNVLTEQVEEATQFLNELLLQASERMQSTGRNRVVLSGLPNAGKSTLFNALCGRSAALVSDVQGTTRDYLTAAIDCAGIAVELVDTAGTDFPVAKLQYSDDSLITAEAQQQRIEQIQRADLIVWCSASDMDEQDRAGDECRIREQMQQHSAILRVRTKADLAVTDDRSGDLAVSAHSGDGLDEFLQAMSRCLADTHRTGHQFVGTTAARCRESLASSVNSLKRARDAAAAEAGEELVAIELRDALDHLGRIVGAVYTDDILDRIFSKFCIGK